MKWTVFCNAEDRFSCVWAFLQKKFILELKCTKSLLLELLRTPILVLVQISKLWECEATDAQKHLSQWEKVAKCNFKSKAQAHEKCFFLMKCTVFCNAGRQIFMSLSFFAEKVILELKCTNHFLELLRTPILCFSATKQIMRMRATDAQKHLSQWEKGS